MELRVLQYFLAVAREQNISAAAESPHLSQPTLSTQLKALEQEHLDRGLIDFGVVYSPVDTNVYSSIQVPIHDTWGGTDAERFSAGPKRPGPSPGPAG